MPIDTHIHTRSTLYKWASARNDSAPLAFEDFAFRFRRRHIAQTHRPMSRWIDCERRVLFSSAYRSQQHTKDADREILRFLNTKESKWVETCVHPFKVHVVLLRAAFVSNKRAPFRRTTKATREFLFWFFCQSRSQTTDAHLMWVEKNAIVVQCAKNILFSAFDKINGKKKFQPDWKYVYAWSKVIL